MSLATTNLTDLPAAPTARRARSPRATSRQADRADSKPRKVSFYLPPELVRRLGVMASMMDSDKSKVLGQVLASSPMLRRFVVSDRSRDTDLIGQDLPAA